MKPKAHPLTSFVVPPRHAAVLPSTRVAGGAASMHAVYEEEDERVLQHASEEELACHCRLRPRGGGTHGGCRGGSWSRVRQTRKLGALSSCVSVPTVILAIKRQRCKQRKRLKRGSGSFFAAKRRLSGLRTVASHHLDWRIGDARSAEHVGRPHPTVRICS